MVTCTRLLRSDTAHRVYGHETKCKHPHGHGYVYEITAEAAYLDAIGRVIDFSVIKDCVGKWIDEFWDHNFIVYEKDEETVKALRWISSGKNPFVAPWNPTAENMAKYLLEVVCPKELSGTGVVVTKVVVWETPNCKAEATFESKTGMVPEKQESFKC